MIGCVESLSTCIRNPAAKWEASIDFVSHHMREALRDVAVEDLNSVTKALYAPLVAHVSGLTEQFDLPYGAHPRQTIDVYRVDDGRRCKSAVLFVPGGGFTSGDKRQGHTFYGNVGRFFAQNGLVGFTMNYRLAPEHVWPSAACDIQSAVAWIKAHSSDFGVDPEQIAILGHSAGAAHVASFLFDPDIKGGNDVSAAIMVSGVYAVRPSTMRPNIAQYFGENPATFERRSALTHVAGSRVPVMLAIAEHDPARLAAPSFELAAALTERDGAAPTFLSLDDHNHFSTLCSFGTQDRRLSHAVLRFLGRTARQA